MTPFLVCVLSSCAVINSFPDFTSVSAKRKSQGLEKEIELSQECRQINANGDFLTLLGKLKADANELFAIEVTPKNDSKIAIIEERIQRATDKITTILDPNLTAAKWPHQISWRMAGADVLKIHPMILERGFEFGEFQIEKVQLAGLPRRDLTSLLEVRANKMEISVVLRKNASSLELCQLQDTLRVRVRYTYKFYDHKFSGSGDLIVVPGAKWEMENL